MQKILEHRKSIESTGTDPRKIIKTVGKELIQGLKSDLNSIKSDQTAYKEEFYKPISEGMQVFSRGKYRVEH